MDALKRRRSGTPPMFKKIEQQADNLQEVYSILKRPVSLPLLQTRSPSPAPSRKQVQFSGQEMASRKTSR